MRYRKMDANGDYVFQGQSLFLINTPESVAQAILTRLKLFVGEWFLDKRVGLNLGLILGYGTQATRDAEVQRRILQTPGVVRLKEYSSSVDADRGFHVTANVDTIYGPATIDEVL